MCSESLPKEFEKTTEVLPFTKYGISTIDEFQEIESKLRHQEWLKKIGLTSEEIKLYQENESGALDQRTIVEKGVLRSKIESIYNKINTFSKDASSSNCDEEPSTSNTEIKVDKIQKTPLKFYPEGHPMNNLKEIEDNLFGHLKDDVIPITKRRKILRRLERRKERILAQENKIIVSDKNDKPTVSRPGSLWDVKDIPVQKPVKSRSDIIGPKRNTMYTIKDNKIVRLEPVRQIVEEYQAVDIVIPQNEAERHLLEGTKMCIDDIKKIDRFKDYEPGVPSKVLYLKNIAPAVSQEQLSLLFNQFVLDNGGPVDVRLMTGRMRGQAFVAFQNENTAVQALEEVNGTILSGRPVIAQFGRNTNRIQPDDT